MAYFPLKIDRQRQNDLGFVTDRWVLEVSPRVEVTAPTTGVPLRSFLKQTQDTKETAPLKNQNCTKVPSRSIVEMGSSKACCDGALEGRDETAEVPTSFCLHLRTRVTQKAIYKNGATDIKVFCW